jgi:hypothetical protein
MEQRQEGDLTGTDRLPAWLRGRLRDLLLWKESLQGDPAQQHHQIGLDQGKLSLQVGRAVVHLRRLRIAIVRRPALHDVADEHFRTAQPDLLQ